MTKQSFLDFACEVMIQSPCGRKHFGRDQKIEIEDVQKFLDQNISGEFDFLLKHCERKYSYYSYESDLFYSK